jgi:hypothetical protein
VDVGVFTDTIDFQINFVPDFEHVYFNPPDTKVLFNFVHVFPAMELTTFLVVVETEIPLFHTKRLFTRRHVYFNPPDTKVLFNFVQLRPETVFALTVDVVEIC